LHKKVIKSVISRCGRTGNPLGFLLTEDHIPKPMKHSKITEEGLAALVSAFYAKVRQDPLIGPVFKGAIEDWDEHLPKLQSFWSSLMLGTGRYKGRPMPAHLKHGDRISPALSNAG
jgi:truncated hemoglobin YjbI